MDLVNIILHKTTTILVSDFLINQGYIQHESAKLSLRNWQWIIIKQLNSLDVFSTCQFLRKWLYTIQWRIPVLNILWVHQHIKTDVYTNYFHLIN